LGDNTTPILRDWRKQARASKTYLVDNAQLEASRVYLLGLFGTRLKAKETSRLYQPALGQS